MHRQQQWARVVAAATAQDAGADRASVLRTAMELGLEVAPGMVGCSVTELSATGFRTAVSANDLALQLDLAQYAANDGPCLSAARNGVVHRLDAMSGDPRFPAFAAAARQHGVHSSVSLPLIGVPAALNFYADRPAAFRPARPRAVADLLARCVSTLLDRPRAEDRVPAGEVDVVRSRRDLVRRAQDALAEQRGLPSRDALDELIRRSRIERRSLYEVAADVCAAHGDGAAP